MNVSDAKTSYKGVTYVKIGSFQIKQNVLNLKFTLAMSSSVKSVIGMVM